MKSFYYHCIEEAKKRTPKQRAVRRARAERQQRRNELQQYGYPDGAMLYRDLDHTLFRRHPSFQKDGPYPFGFSPKSLNNSKLNPIVKRLYEEIRLKAKRLNDMKKQDISDHYLNLLQQEYGANTVDVSSANELTPGEIDMLVDTLHAHGFTIPDQLLQIYKQKFPTAFHDFMSTFKQNNIWDNVVDDEEIPDNIWD